MVEAEKIPEVKITVDYHPGRWGKTFHIFDLDNREIVLSQKDAARLARNLTSLAQERHTKE